MNPTGTEIISLALLIIGAIIGLLKLMEYADDANKHIDGTFSTDWGKR